jgi:hypothetical protein
MSEYYKFRFTSKTNGSTAGLILEGKSFKEKSIVELSKLFPMREASKMESLQVSEPFGTWNDAFHHSFDKGE